MSCGLSIMTVKSTGHIGLQQRSAEYAIGRYSAMKTGFVRRYRMAGHGAMAAMLESRRIGWATAKLPARHGRHRGTGLRIEQVIDKTSRGTIAADERSGPYATVVEHIGHAGCCSSDAVLRTRMGLFQNCQPGALYGQRRTVYRARRLSGVPAAGRLASFFQSSRHHAV
jgi:hypothetical protein